MSPQALLHVPGHNVPVLHELAAQVGVTPETYTEQSLRLGVYLASLVATNPGDGELSVLFEEADGFHRECKIDFQVSEYSPATDDTESAVSELEAQFAETQPDDAVLEINAPLMGMSRQLAAAFEVSEAEYVVACISLRWLWAVSRSIDGDILLSDGDPAGYIELEDSFLD